MELKIGDIIEYTIIDDYKRYKFLAEVVLVGINIYVTDIYDFDKKIVVDETSALKTDDYKIVGYRKPVLDVIRDIVPEEFL